MYNVTNFRLGIAVPLSFPMIPSPFFDTFITMDKPQFIYLRSSHAHIDDMRNDLVQQAFMNRCTHLIMCDSDQVYHRKTITRLLSHRLPVVGCLVYRRYPPFDPLMLRGRQGHYTSILEWEPESLVEVDATGTGCLLFDMAVFRKLPFPWFRFRKGAYGETIGEDFGACIDLKEAGYRIFVDTSIPAGHLSKMEINEGTWKLYNKTKEAELKREHELKHGILTNKVSKEV
jgi:hypothetical protein